MLVLDPGLVSDPDFVFVSDPDLVSEPVFAAGVLPLASEPVFAVVESGFAGAPFSDALPLFALA